MSELGRRCSVQRFSTNASHNDHVLLPLCTSSTGSTPLEKSERRKQLQRLLPFSQVFTTAALHRYQTDGASSSSTVQALRSQQVRSGNRRNARKYVHNRHTLLTLHTCLHMYASTNVDSFASADTHTHLFCLGKLPQLFGRHSKYPHAM